MIFDALVAAYLARHGWRSMLGVLAIALGVASALAADIGAANTSRAARAGLAALGSDAGIVIDAPGRGVSAAEAAKVAAAPGVLAVRPVVVRIATAGGEPVRLAVVDTLQPFPGSASLRAFAPGPFAAPGDLERALVARAGAVLSPGLARRLRLGVGSRFTVRVTGEPLALRVAAIFARTPAALDPQMILVDLATFDGGVDRLDVVVAGDEVGARREALARALGRGVRVEAAADRLRRFALAGRGLALDLRTLAFFALAVGALVTVDAVASSVRARRPQIATLRMLGATRSAIARAFALETLLVGALGAAVGVILGAALALRSSGPEAADVAGADVVLGLRDGLAGIALAGCAALVPALQAAAVAPARGLRDEPKSAASVMRRLAVAGCASLGIAIAAAVLAIGPPDARGRLAIAAAAIGTGCVLPLALDALGRAVGRARGLPLPVRLAALRLNANALRASVAAAELVAALAGAVCAATVAGSFRTAIAIDAARRYPGDLTILSARGFGDARTRGALCRRIARVAGVASARYVEDPGGGAALSVGASPNAPLAGLRVRLVRAARPAAIDVESTRALREGARTAYERSTADAALVGAASLAVALFATLGSLAALVLERRRELELVRVLGLSAGALRTSVVCEAAAIAAIAAALGAPLGLTIGAIVIVILGREGLGWDAPLVFPLALAASLPALAMAVAALAASIPVARLGRIGRRALATGAVVCLVASSGGLGRPAEAAAPHDRMTSLALRLREANGARRRFIGTVTLAEYALAPGRGYATGAFSLRGDDGSTPVVVRQAERTGPGAIVGSAAWRIVRRPGSGRATFDLAAGTDAAAIALRLVAERPAFAIVEFGGSAYPRLRATGKLAIAGRRFAVAGTGWLETSDDAASRRSPCEVERYLFSFDDGRDLELIARRRCDGTYAVRTTAGDRFEAPVQSALGSEIPTDAYAIDRGGRATRLAPGVATLLIAGPTLWHSPHDRATYPALWLLDVPFGLGALDVAPLDRDQEIDGGFESAPTWFGALDVAQHDLPGLHVGSGFAELTGFAQPPYRAEGE